MTSSACDAHLFFCHGREHGLGMLCDNARNRSRISRVEAVSGEKLDQLVHLAFGMTLKLGLLEP